MPHAIRQRLCVALGVLHLSHVHVAQDRLLDGCRGSWVQPVAQGVIRSSRDAGQGG